MSDLFAKGNFEPINVSFIKESVTALDKISLLQKKYQKPDMDTLLNELHDSIVGKYLGFELINTQKHGFDCKLNITDEIFLESKVVSYASSSWQATFNDTTMDKVEAFRSGKVWLALSLWMSVSDILCICFGNNQNIANILEAGILKHKVGKTVRSTQSISMNRLISEFNFTVLSTSLS